MQSELAIPIIKPGDVDHLLRYFSGVDEALSRRFAIGFLPDEEHLTSLLCELLDEKGSELHALSYSVSNLNSDLKNSGSLLTTSVSLSTTPYNKYQERYFTQSDIGIVVKYVDNIDPSCSFKKGLLVQAKKLFPYKDKIYTLNSKYNSFNAEQHERLTSMIEYYGMRRDKDSDKLQRKRKMIDGGLCAAYLLYNPPITVFSQIEQELIIHRQLRQDSRSIFDYMDGLRLYHELSEREEKHPMQRGGSVFVGPNDVHRLALVKQGDDDTQEEKLTAFSVGALSESVDLRAASLPWFFVFNLLLGRAGCADSEFVSLVSGNSHGMAKEFGIPPPRFVLEIEISAGTQRLQ